MDLTLMACVCDNQNTVGRQPEGDEQHFCCNGHTHIKLFSVRTVTIIAYIYTSINRLRICVIYHLVPAVFCVLSVPIAFVNSEVPESGELFSLKWHNCKYH